MIRPILENNMSDKQVKVRVSDRWRVVHDGKPYVKGDVVTVPEHVAKEWESSGWVERVGASKERQSSKDEPGQTA
jgi:hypothetical protein